MMCTVENCGNEAKRSGLCWGHVKRRQRNTGETQLLREYGLTPWRRVLEACFELLDIPASDTDEWRRALNRIIWALRVYRTKARKVGRPLTTQDVIETIQEHRRKARQ